MVNSPKWVDLTGFLHGHPGTDETGDQTAGNRKVKGRNGRVRAGKEENKWLIEGQKTQKDTNRKGAHKNRVSDRQQKQNQQRSAKVHFFKIIFYSLKSHNSFFMSRNSHITTADPCRGEQMWCYLTSDSVSLVFKIKNKLTNVFILD